VRLNALPSIARLTSASDHLRDIEVMCAAYGETLPEQRARTREAIQATWPEIDSELAAYAGLPMFPGEFELYAAVPGALRATREAVRHFIEISDSDAPKATRASAAAEVHERIEAAAARLLEVTQYNADNAQRSAQRIEALRDHAAAAALALDGIAVVVAIAATVWLSGLFREHARLLQENSELTEQRAAELEVFGRRVAHDLLSPLSSLTYCLTAFKRPADADPSLRDAMLRAEACVVRARTMVEGIFEFARSGGKPDAKARTPLAEVVEQIADDIGASDPRTRPEIVVEPLPDVQLACNRGVLTSLLSNLMRNAQKFMSDTPVRKIVVRARDEGARLHVEVEDTGPGVALEIRDAIFEPYVRADAATQPGLGLGLATVKRLCAAHGGEVGVRSTLGRGSTFWFTLPKADSSANEASVVDVRSREVVRAQLLP
jgi:signal transduction histidine kinase